MIPKRGDQTKLLRIARAVATEVKARSEGTSLRIRLPTQIRTTLTNGWATSIGDLGRNRPTLEVWLDRFTAHDDRKLWACFSGNRQQLSRITKQVAKKLVPYRVITADDTTNKRFLKLSKALQRSAFHQPILEKYSYGETFLGIYDFTMKSSDRLIQSFSKHAAAFFESVARSLHGSRDEDESYEVYPKNENRTSVASHLRRERSRLLATACKERDGYTCQVCSLNFLKVYGLLGEDFAEAHHLVPLSQLRENVKTRLEDLATVCANCHRMLHRMAGKRDDIAKLRSIVRKKIGN